MDEEDSSTFYALFIIDSSGVETFGGAFQDRKTAENKGEASGKQFAVRPVNL